MSFRFCSFRSAALVTALSFTFIAAGGVAPAQVLPQGGGGGASGGAGGGNGSPTGAESGPGVAAQKKGAVLGESTPFFDPGSEITSWDGKMWNVTDNRAFQARFEKYLASPAASSEEDEKYRKVLEEIDEYLSPSHNGGKPSLPQAVALLPVASKFPIDAKLCDSLAGAIYGVWLSQKNLAILRQTNDAMKQQVNTTYFYGQQLTAPLAQRTGTSTTGKGAAQNQSSTPAQQITQLGPAAQYIKDIAELEAKMKLNEASMGASQALMKGEFQALIVQFAIQRRFEHVVMACRFYRQILQDANGIMQLQKGSDAEKMFATSLGTAPTVSALDSFASEMIRDVDEGVQAFDELIGRGDLASASKRLSEAFLVGEYLPRIRRVPMDKKLTVLDFTRDFNKLISAIEVKDYTSAKDLVDKMKKEAKDFDYAKPQAAIQTAEAVSEVHLNDAKIAAMNHDQKASADALRLAAEIWPTNPKLKDFTTMIGSNADIKTQATLDLDRLMSQRNYRQIYNDQGRYLAAVMDDPTRREQLAKVLTDMNRVNLMIAAANGAEQNGNVPGAWEGIENAFKQFPDDPELARLRSEFSVKASDFVSALQKGKDHEERKQTGSALAWYLKAKSEYPASTYAKEGIQRIVDNLGKDPQPQP